MRLPVALVCLLLLPPGSLCAQSRTAAEPIEGLRDNRPRDYAFTGAEVTVEPGRSLVGVTVLVRGTTITAVGKDIEIPPGFQTIDCKNRRIYPGLIDAWSETEVPAASSQAGYWNSNITPEVSAAAVAAKAITNAEKLRSQGITTRVVAPKAGIVKGSSCVMLVSDGKPGRTLLKETAWQHLQLTVPRGGSRPSYPNSPMGAVALLRQSMYDANWYRDAWNVYRATPELPRPETNLALETLSHAIVHDTFVIDGPNERMAIRAGKIADEFALKMIVRGSGREYRQLDEIAAMNRPILVPVSFPEVPDVKSDEAVADTTLGELMHWDLAPENPARLAEAGVQICLTTDSLDQVDQFLKQVRLAVQRGLSAEMALASLTTVPAKLLGLADHCGRVAPGMLANLVITDGDLFESKTKVLETWVAGEQFVVTPDSDAASAHLLGRWRVSFRHGGKPVMLELVLNRDKEKLSGTLGSPASSPVNENSAAENKDPDPKKSTQDANSGPVKLQNLIHQRDRLAAAIDLHEIDAKLPAGLTRLSMVTVVAEPGQTQVTAKLTFPNGQTESVDVALLPADNENEDAKESAETAKDKTDDANDSSKPDSPSSPNDSGSDSDERTMVWFPLGAYGLPAPPPQQGAVLFRQATLWTCDTAGVIERGDVLVRDGLIAAVGENLAVPAGCQIIDARGKHITPGLIDCHSHIATDGGINESGQAVTAEVRVGDFLDNSDISIYRQLAGGLTTVNILHGSANPIGGQNQVIKLRWGESMDGLRMTQAPAGIKFALGENVKRNQSRYPNTRMGVEQIIRDQLLAARQYQAEWRRWRSGDRHSLPPRVDLQLEAMAEVGRNERWVHCHSYRQDEIVATLDVLEEFGIRIGTLQHILEGYKVADRMARHGAMGSSFSDWWAYKFEVYDAIPYNGAVMHDQGVVVSFNSDDAELARRMNTEAAKATKYGGVPEQEALKFVTLNPAKQLRIDQFVGSLTVGKHADLVLWSGRPLSTLSRCEQTWIDGRRYFDRATDQQLHDRDIALKARLIQKALAAGGPSKTSAKKEVEEEDRWYRHDIYCGANGGAENDSRTGGRR